MATGASVTDKRHRWSREDNKELIICWMMSSPDHQGFRRRLYDVYHERNPESGASEQLLAGLVRAMLKRKVFSNLEFEEIRQGLANSPVECTSPFLTSPDDASPTLPPEDTVELSQRSPVINSARLLNEVDVPSDDRPTYVFQAK